MSASGALWIFSGWLVSVGASANIGPFRHSFSLLHKENNKAYQMFINMLYIPRKHPRVSNHQTNRKNYEKLIWSTLPCNSQPKHIIQIQLVQYSERDIYIYICIDWPFRVHIRQQMMAGTRLQSPTTSMAPAMGAKQQYLERQRNWARNANKNWSETGRKWVKHLDC